MSPLLTTSPLQSTIKRKADLLNCFFATVGTKLADTINPQYRTITTIKPKLASCIYDARVSYGEVANKLITLKTNKATGPDGISLWLLAAAYICICTA